MEKKSEVKPKYKIGDMVIPKYMFWETSTKDSLLK